MQFVANGVVCGPEEYLQRRRLGDREHVGDELHGRLLSTVWTVETCYTACYQRLAPDNSYFVMNIYRNITLGQQVCTCCRTCQGLRYVPGAQVFAVSGLVDQGRLPSTRND